MSHSLDDLLGQGLLLALSREDAKQLFAAREPTRLRQFLQDRLPEVMSEACAAESEPGIAVCGGQWQQIQHVLDQGVTVDESLRPALQQCLTGGRILWDGVDLKVWLIRPDMVPHVAQALQGLDVDLVQQQLSGAASCGNGSATSRLVEAALPRISQFYQHAADEQAAVVFAARPPG